MISFLFKDKTYNISENAIKYNQQWFDMYTETGMLVVMKEPVPVSANFNVEITEETIEKIIEWSDYHSIQGDTFDDGAFKDWRQEDLKEFDLNFLRKWWNEVGDMEFIKQMTMIDFIGNDVLLKIMAIYVGEQIITWSDKKIRAAFDQPDDLTDEEKQLIIKNNSWLNED